MELLALCCLKKISICISAEGPEYLLLFYFSIKTLSLYFDSYFFNIGFLIMFFMGLTFDKLGRLNELEVFSQNLIGSFSAYSVFLRTIFDGTRIESFEM